MKQGANTMAKLDNDILFYNWWVEIKIMKLTITDNIIRLILGRIDITDSINIYSLFFSKSKLYINKYNTINWLTYYIYWFLNY